MYEVAIFDMDGTILDTLQDVTDSLNWALEKHSLPTRTLDEVRYMVGNGARHLVESAVPKGSSTELIEAVFNDNKVRYQAHCSDHTKPYPGIMELLRSLKCAGVKLAVVSNKPHAAVQELVQEVFEGLFDVAYGQTDEIPRKPDATMVHLALQELQNATSQTADVLHQNLDETPHARTTAQPSAVYIGDSEVDVETARNANLPMFTVLWGFRKREELEKAGATHFATTTEQLKDAILNPSSSALSE